MGIRSKNRCVVHPVTQVSTRLCVLGLILMMTPACEGHPPREAAVASPLAVRTAILRRGAMQETLDYVGTVHSRNEVTVLAQMAGKLVDLPLGEGEAVVTGAVLARIAAPETSARVSRLGAEVGRAEEESAFLCRQSQTDRALVEKKAISAIKADTSQQRCEASRAGVRAARSGLRELEIMAAKTVERAPFEGRVLRWIARPGENTMPGRPLLVVGDSPREVRVQVQEKDLDRGVAVGMTALLQVDGADPIRTSVSFVAPIARGPGRLVELRLPLPEDLPAGGRASFRHGRSVDVLLVLKREADVSSVPRGAIATNREGRAVFVVQEDSRLRRLPVTTGIQEAGWIALGADLPTGARVVVGSLDMLRDGLTVYPVASPQE
jgi:RND family efflux transporter MFP subunit